MPIVSRRIAQADDPIYKSGLTISIHSTSSESTRDILKSRTGKRQQTQDEQNQDHMKTSIKNSAPDEV